MGKITLIVRVLLGLVFFGSGCAFFFTTPPPIEGPMGVFFQGLEASRYFLYLLKGTEIVCGLLLLTGRFVPLALVVLAPIILNIFCVHVFIMPEGLPMAIIMGIFEIHLAFFSVEYRSKIRALFHPL